jgi:hypothetical protein
LNKKPIGDDGLCGSSRFFALRHSRYFIAAISIALIGLCCHSAYAFDEAPDPVLTTSSPSELWLFLPLGYLFTVAIETPVLIIGLSRSLTLHQRLFAGLWLSACTYPIVVLVLPLLFASSPRSLYLLVAETFAPVAECALFWVVFRKYLEPGRLSLLRNLAVVVVANLLSFGAGEILNSSRWFGLF